MMFFDSSGLISLILSLSSLEEVLSLSVKTTGLWWIAAVERWAERVTRDESDLRRCLVYCLREGISPESFA